MRIHRPELLQAFWIKYPDAEASLRAWFHEAKSSVWSTLADLKERHRTATVLADGRVSFNICQTKYRVVVRIDFTAGIVIISAIDAGSE